MANEGRADQWKSSLKDAGEKVKDAHLDEPTPVAAPHAFTVCGHAGRAYASAMSATDMVVWILGVMTCVVITSCFVGPHRRSRDDPPDNGSGRGRAAPEEAGVTCEPRWLPNR